MSEEIDNEVDDIRIAFDDGQASDMSDDEIKLAMIQAGASFTNVTRLFNQYMIDAGLAMSREEKDELVEDVVGSANDIETEDGFESVVQELVSRGTNIDEKRAAAIIRNYAKKNEVPVFTRQRGGGGGPSGWRDIYFDMLVENPRMTEQELKEILKNHPSASDNTRRHESHYQAIRKMANRIVG